MVVIFLIKRFTRPLARARAIFLLIFEEKSGRSLVAASRTAVGRLLQFLPLPVDFAD